MFDAEFFDIEAIGEGASESVVDEITQRTPGFNTWQGGAWPVCCDDATAFLTPVGIQQLREQFRELEGQVLNHIIYNLHISGGAALKMLESIRKDAPPTAYVFRCLHCNQLHFFVDQL
jgi:uncharacterized protein CbrC (UPF0167 family)